MKKILMTTVLAVCLLGIAYYSFSLQEDPKAESLSSTPPISASKVPEGWYSHDMQGIDGTSTVLTRDQSLSKDNDESITITLRETQLAPEEYVLRQGAVADTTSASQWGTYQGHKTFSTSVVSGNRTQWVVFLFGVDKAYSFILSPNDQTNPNLAQDRTDFWRVITYYAQEQAFEKLSREETLRNCRTVNLRDGIETTIQSDPEFGYVTVNYRENDKNVYVFLNFQDDLESCTPSVRELLTNAKEGAAGLLQNQSDSKSY